MYRIWDISQKQTLEHEKIQIALRVGIVLPLFFLFPLLQTDYFSQKHFGISIYNLMEAEIVLNFLYYFIIQNYPTLLQEQRILFFVLFDITVTIFAMAHGNEIALYFVWLPLWMIVGYGMRYNAKVMFTAYLAVLIGWAIMISLSFFWQNHIPIGIGMLITYAIIPLYFFKLVAEQKELIKELHKEVKENLFRAEHDPLTKLPNRFAFMKELDFCIQHCKQFALFFIDLDGFKRINDTFGHEIGDMVLVEASKRINKYDLYAARLGGDEFAAIVEYKNLDEVNRVAQELIGSIGSQCNNPLIKLSASIGIALYPHDTKDEHELKKRADKAMYTAKNFGKNRYVFYSDMSQYFLKEA